MMKPNHRLFVVCLLCLSGLASAQADDRTAAELLPPSTTAYVELTEPGNLLSTVLDHPTYRWFQRQPAYREAVEQKQFLEFKAVVALVEAQLGRTWRRILSAAAGGGVFVAFDAKSEGVAMLIKSQEDGAQEQVVQTLVGLARLDAKNKGGEDPIKITEHRDVKQYQVSRAHIGVFGNWLAVCNQRGLLTSLIDNGLTNTEKTLAKSDPFVQARSGQRGDVTAWGYLNMNVLREAGIGRSLSRATMDNPVAELLVGGTLSVLQKTPYLTAELNVHSDGLRLQVGSVHDADWVEQRREYFFGQQGRGVAPPLLTADDTLLSLSAYRDVSQLWLRSGELFNEQVNDGLAQADSTLSTLFSGKDFGEDILGAVMPQIQLVVTRQSLAQDAPRPAVTLPAFGLVFRLKDPERMTGELRRTFQSLIGFLNIVGSMNGQPQLDLGMERTPDHQLVTSTYLVDADQDPESLPINFNFSPTIGFRGERFVVASTKHLARKLINDTSISQPTESANTVATANAGAVRDVLADNRQQLVAQNMLEEGHTRAEAEREIDTLLALLNFIRDASLTLATGDKTLKLGLELQLKE